MGMTNKLDRLSCTDFTLSVLLLWDTRQRCRQLSASLLFTFYLSMYFYQSIFTHFGVGGLTAWRGTTDE